MHGPCNEPPLLLFINDLEREGYTRVRLLYSVEHAAHLTPQPSMVQ